MNRFIPGPYQDNWPGNEKKGWAACSAAHVQCPEIMVGVIVPRVVSGSHACMSEVRIHQQFTVACRTGQPHPYHVTIGAVNRRGGKVFAHPGTAPVREYAATHAGSIGGGV